MQLFLKDGTFGVWWTCVWYLTYGERSVGHELSWWENLHRCVSTNLTVLRGSETNNSVSFMRHPSPSFRMLHK